LTQNLESLFKAGLTLHQQGRLADAEAVYRQVCALAPHHADARHYLGVVALQTGRASEAVQLISAALQGAANPVFHVSLARAHAQMGGWADALESLDRALELNPRFVGALIDRGNLLLDLARPTEALMAFERAIALEPGDASAMNGAGNALLDVERPADALSLFTRAVGLNPTEPRFLLNRALAYSRLRRPADVLQDCLQSRLLGHATAQLYFVEGNALLDLGRAMDAVHAFEAAIALDPDSARAFNNRGTALVDLGRHDLALASFERCLVLTAGALDDADLRLQAQLNRCSALKDLGRRTEAWAGLEELVRVAPDIKYAAGLLMHERLARCDWRDYRASVAAITDSIDRGKPADGPFTFLALTDSPAAQLRCAQLRAADTCGVAPQPRYGEDSHENRLRIGYLSSDFREHAVAYLMAGIFEAHDRSRFEVFAFSVGADDGSALRKRLEAGFEHFVDVAQMQDATIAARMAEVSIDVLVDLNGSTSGGRSGLLAMRPAPVQISYLGYPGTTGTTYVDYLIADEFVIPPESQRHYSEQVVYLPECFQANDDRRPIGPAYTRRDAGLPDAAIVFCSFNNSYKLNPVMFDIWCRLLRAVSGSVLWLVLNDESARENLRREAGARGVAADRLVFAGQEPYARHLARLGLADLFLDTLPFNAGATASDALWAGLPVITCAGEAFAARMAGSLLRALRLPELITCNLADYERLALELVVTPARLAALRARLHENRLETPLFDSERQCRNLEAAYSEIWSRHLSGKPAASFTVKRPSALNGI
jgi:protein O-GlcNAc transferase